MNGRLEIRALGGLSVTCDREPVTDFDSRKVAALLVYLACTGQDHPREVLAEMLWEGRTQSLSNLRVVLTSLRQTVGMNPEADWWLDVAAFEGHLSAGRLSQVVDLYQGDFLSGFYVDSDIFEDWAQLERERLRLLAVDTLGRLVALNLEQGSFSDGMAHATHLLPVHC